MQFDSALQVIHINQTMKWLMMCIFFRVRVQINNYITILRYLRTNVQYSWCIIISKQLCGYHGSYWSMQVVERTHFLMHTMRVTTNMHCIRMNQDLQRTPQRLVTLHNVTSVHTTTLKNERELNGSKFTIFTVFTIYTGHVVLKGKWKIKLQP